jgi:hypothetical protein
VCEVWRQITWSKGDTRKTVSQVQRNNRANAEYCKD